MPRRLHVKITNYTEKEKVLLTGSQKNADLNMMPFPLLQDE